MPGMIKVNPGGSVQANLPSHRTTDRTTSLIMLAPLMKKNANITMAMGKPNIRSLLARGFRAIRFTRLSKTAHERDRVFSGLVHCQAISADWPLGEHVVR